MKSRTRGVILALATVGMLWLPMNVAKAVTVDGKIGEWGVDVSNTTGIYSAANPTDTNPDVFNNTIGAAQWIGDGYDAANWGKLTSGPGYGGQNEDMEAMYSYYGDGGNGHGLYVAVVTGFSPGGVWDWNDQAPQLRAGDVFIRFGNNTGWNAAIETTGLNTQGDPQPWSAGGVVGTVYSGATGTTWWTMGAGGTVGYPEYGPAEIVHDTADYPADTAGLTAATAVTTTNFVYTDVVPDNGNAYVEGGAGNGGYTIYGGQYCNMDDPSAPHPYADGYGGNQYDHNVVEVFLSQALLESLGWQNGQDVTALMSEQCGNDTAEVATVTVPVPEPITMLMLGCLGAGMLGARKVRQVWRKAE